MEKETVPLKHGPADKLIIIAESTDGKEFRISEAWTKSARGQEKVLGLWISLDTEGNLNSRSTLAKLLKYLELKTPADLIGLQTIGYPDDSDFTVLTTYDRSQKET